MGEPSSVLSRAEWDDFFAVSHGSFVDEADRTMKMDAIRRSMAEAALNARRYDAAAALAIYDQPNGFTWEDVDRLRALPAATATPALADLADRIAALLPPRR